MNASRPQSSEVERRAIEASRFELQYPPVEKAKVIVVASFPELGKLTALRFIEWVQQNPGGVVALPTGKTPEHFISWVKRIVAEWDHPEIRALLERAGVVSAVRPDLASLHFVQIDDFYPIESSQKNSFFWYVNNYYLSGFGLDPAKALLIRCDELGLSGGQRLRDVWPEQTVDLALRHRAARGALERTQQDVLFRVDEWCSEYERKIRALGGIGFFLGGIGPDGHIGFNVRGSDHFSTTRLAPTNYETQAAAATDLGGIEVARRRHVITIGLRTITYNENCVAIIMAAGEAKAAVVADAVEHAPDVLYPATALQRLPRARFYLTRGAAGRLSARRLVALEAALDPAPADVERIVIDVALASRKRLTDLTRLEFQSDALGSALLRRLGESGVFAACGRAREAIIERIDSGSRPLANTRFLHTEPHHDDVMLAYLPAIVRNIRQASNTHHFATLTSGFTAVTNTYLRNRLERLLGLVDSPGFAELDAAGYFAPEDIVGRNRDVWQYLDGVAAADAAMRDEGAARRLARDIREVYGLSTRAEIARVARDVTSYLADAYPGKKDPPEVQKLKGMGREWEVETLWGYFGWSRTHINHLRLGFYTGDIFTEEPTAARDVPPILELLRRTRPDVVSVALDPEGSGPDTHYKVLQAIAAALEHLREAGEPTPGRVWGYRNVWYRFHPSEANVYVPVSLNMFATMDNAFRNTFVSQREASFPSHEHDGPFCELAQRIQVEQYQTLKTCLGREWFHEHASPLVRGTRGFVFLRELTPAAFAEHSRGLKRATENR